MFFDGDEPKHIQSLGQIQLCMNDQSSRSSWLIDLTGAWWQEVAVVVRKKLTQRPPRTQTLPETMHTAKGPPKFRGRATVNRQRRDAMMTMRSTSKRNGQRFPPEWPPWLIDRRYPNHQDFFFCTKEYKRINYLYCFCLARLLTSRCQCRTWSHPISKFIGVSRQRQKFKSQDCMRKITQWKTPLLMIHSRMLNKYSLKSI
jgi:hypothetical protein